VLLGLVASMTLFAQPASAATHQTARDLLVTSDALKGFGADGPVATARGPRTGVNCGRGITLVPTGGTQASRSFFRVVDVSPDQTRRITETVTETVVLTRSVSQAKAVLRGYKGSDRGCTSLPVDDSDGVSRYVGTASFHLAAAPVIGTAVGYALVTTTDVTISTPGSLDRRATGSDRQVTYRSGRALVTVSLSRSVLSYGQDGALFAAEDIDDRRTRNNLRRHSLQAVTLLAQQRP
jgi:hypothetical protein